MLVLSGSKMGLRMHVLSENETDPAAQVTRIWHQGSLSDPHAIKNFVSKIDYLTFESEFIDTRLLQDSVLKKVKIFPQIDIVEKIQDRLTQKELLLTHKLPTSPYVSVASVPKAFDDLKSDKLVFKKRKFGYDGYGTYILNLKQTPTFNPQTESLIAEQFIPFQRELAVTLARSETGEIAVFPLVETYQKNSRCVWVKGETNSKFFPALLPKLKKMLARLNYVGVLTFELFETKNGLIINELAPRVHNSCHHSLDSCNLNQFEAHLLAGLDLKLGKIKVHSPFAMMNLLGTGEKETCLSLSESVSLHWYGKLENKPQRKMGHITALGPTSSGALRKLQIAQRKMKV